MKWCEATPRPFKLDARHTVIFYIASSQYGYVSAGAARGCPRAVRRRLLADADEINI